MKKTYLAFILLYLILHTLQIDQENTSQPQFKFPIYDIKDFDYSKVASNDGVFKIIYSEDTYYIYIYETEEDGFRIKNSDIYNNKGVMIRSDVLLKTNTISAIKQIKTVGVVYHNFGFRIILLKNVEKYAENKYKFDFILKDFKFRDNIITELDTYSIRSDYLDKIKFSYLSMIVFDNFEYLENYLKHFGCY